MYKIEKIHAQSRGVQNYTYAKSIKVNWLKNVGISDSLDMLGFSRTHLASHFSFPLLVPSEFLWATPNPHFLDSTCFLWPAAILGLWFLLPWVLPALPLSTI